MATLTVPIRSILVHEFSSDELWRRGALARDLQALVEWQGAESRDEQQPETVIVPRMLPRRKLIFGVWCRQCARIPEQAG
jgi:hypothetical protein